MLPEDLFSVATVPYILDLAATPGRKTTHLVDRFCDQDLIVANDSSPKRITTLRSNLQTWGAMGVMLTNYPDERLGLWFPKTLSGIGLAAV